MDGDDTSIDVQLSDHGSPDQFLLESTSLRAFSESQESNEDVLLRILIGNKSFPPSISEVISPYQLNVLGSHLIMYFLDANLSSPDVPAW